MVLPNPEVTELVVRAIPVLHDNYAFLLQRRGEAVLVDPAVVEPLIAELEARQLELVAVLHTHHHHDHIGGTPGLLRRWPAAAVIAAAADRARIPFQTQGVAGGDRFVVLGESVDVLSVPGHTSAHLAYVLPNSGHLFCGDTLFGGGCGRLFEGTAQQMWDSLRQFAALPGSTQVWCAHEYTEANLRWALTQLPATDPVHRAVAVRLQRVLAQRQQGLASVPSTIDQELATNLFLRSETRAQLEQLRLSFSRSCNCVHDEPLGGSAGAGIGGVELLANAA